MEQSAGRKGGWSTKVINHPDNLVQIPKEIHRNCINSWMAKKGVNKFGISAAKNQTMRSAVHYQGFTKQYQVGIALLRHCGVNM